MNILMINFMMFMMICPYIVYHVIWIGRFLQTGSNSRRHYNHVQVYFIHQRYRCCQPNSKFSFKLDFTKHLTCR